MRSFISSKFNGLPLHDKIYKIGAYVFVVYAVIVLTVSFFFDSQYISTIANIFAYLIATIFTFAVFAEYWDVLKPLFEKIWLRWIVGGIAYLVFRYSEGKAEDFINSFTGIDPSALPNAVSLLVALFLPYSWIVFISVILGVYLIVILLIAPVQIRKDEKTIGGWKFMGRLVGLLTIFILLSNLITLFDKEDSVSTLIAKETTLRTEYFNRSSCGGVNKDSLVADIGRGFISVYTPKTSKFEVKKCEYEITSD